MGDKKNLTIKTPVEDLAKEIIETDSFEDLKNAVDLFNINLKKKEIIRAKVISDLQGKALDQMSERLEKKAGEFSNKDLLDYYRVLKDTTATQPSLTNAPQIQINQQNINVGDSPASMSRESRERITKAVDAIIAKYAQPQQEAIVIDNDEGEESEDEL